MTTSVSGCWTCRLRRKKCDARLPSCAKCQALQVACAGYGPRPEWMDGGERERAKAAEVREQVKKTTDGLRKSRATIALELRRARLAAARNGNGNGNGASSPPPPTRISPPRSVTASGGGGSHPETFWHDDPEVEEGLLVYYIKEVFPLQFPFYRFAEPVADELPWVYRFLKESEPLHTAALAQAACHQHRKSHDFVLGCDDTGHSAAYKFFASCIQSLRQHVEMLSRKGDFEGLRDSLDALACIVMLVFLNVGNGGTGKWQTHLEAAPTLFPWIRTYCSDDAQQHTNPSGNAFSLKAWADALNISTTTYDKPTSSSAYVDNQAMIFYSSIIIWLDIIACISTDKPPQYPNICHEALTDAPEGRVKLAELMGCQNWVMIIIRDIAVLDHWKRETTRYNVLNKAKLEDRVTAFEIELEAGIKNVVKALAELEMEIRDVKDEAEKDKEKDREKEKEDGTTSSSSSRSSSTANPHLARLIRRLHIHHITHIFALSALIYLHVTTSSTSSSVSSPILQARVSRAAAAFKTLPDPQLLRSLIWPFCVAGAMASKEEDKKVFRGLVERVGVKKGMFGTLWQAWRVVEGCWEVREEEKRDDVDWGVGMERVGFRPLLV